MNSLVALVNGRAKTSVLSRMQNPPDRQPELCNFTIWGKVASHCGTVNTVEFGQNGFTQMTREPAEPGWILISVVLAVRMKSYAGIFGPKPGYAYALVKAPLATTVKPIANIIRLIDLAYPYAECIVLHFLIVRSSVKGLLMGKNSVPPSMST